MRRVILAAVAAALLTATPAGAITGGGPASEPYPWMVSLREGGDHICGGSLVRSDLVLTAAHCVQGGKAENFSVMLGETRLSREQGEIIAAAELTVHEAYETDDAGGHDIALVRLERSSAATPLRLVSLGEQDLWAAGEPARVIGWGSSIFLVGPQSDDLQEVDVPMVSDDDCSASYGLSPFAFDPATMVCAGETTGMRDSCQGDSGGPLVVRDAAGAWTLVGTVSFGLGCGFPLYYGVYGRVGDNPLNDWLTARIGAAAPATAPSGGAGTPPPPTGQAPQQGSGQQAPATPSSTRAPGTRIRFARDLGSARKARRTRRVRVRLRSTGPVSAVRVTLHRKGRRIASGRLRRLDGRATLRLRARRSAIRRGKLTLRVVGRDAGGHPVGARGRVRLR